MFAIVRAGAPGRLLKLLALVATASAGCRREEPAERRVDDLDKVLEAVPDSAMRERWRAAQAEGRLPPLDSLRLPTRPVSTRQRSTLPSNPPGTPNVQIPQGAIADVRAVVTPAVSDYDGPVTLDSVGPARIVARLTDAAGQAARIEIQYKLPEGAALTQSTSQPVSLVFSESVPAGSLRRIIGLTQQRAPLLWRIVDGDSKPYARTFAGAQLSVRQNAPGRDSVSTVTVLYGDRSVTLRPGERSRTRDALGEVEIFLESSYYTPPSLVQLSEGDPYHVRLMVYRVAPQSTGVVGDGD